MQTGAKEKWDETAENAEKQRKEKEKWANARVAAEVYTPRKQVAGAGRTVSRAAQELLEGAQTSARPVIEAERVSEQEQERNRRVLEARRRRMNRR